MIRKILGFIIALYFLAALFGKGPYLSAVPKGGFIDGVLETTHKLVGEPYENPDERRQRRKAEIRERLERRAKGREKKEKNLKVKRKHKVKKSTAVSKKKIR